MHATCKCHADPSVRETKAQYSQKAAVNLIDHGTDLST